MHNSCPFRQMQNVFSASIGNFFRTKRNLERPSSSPTNTTQLVDGVTGLRLGKQAARSLRRYVWRARSRLAWRSEAVVPQTDGVKSTESEVSAPSIIEGRPWSIMQELTCHWNARACVLWTRRGKIVREGKVASEPEALIAWFGSLGFGLTRIGLEAGPLSQWLYAAMRRSGACGRASGDAARAGCVQGDAGEEPTARTRAGLRS